MVKHATKATLTMLGISLICGINHLKANNYDNDEMKQTEYYSNEGELRTYYEHEIADRQAKIDNLEIIIDTLSQERTELYNHIMSKTRDVETAEHKTEELNTTLESTQNDLDTLKKELVQSIKKYEYFQKQLETTKSDLKISELNNKQLRKDLESANQKSRFGIPFGSMAGLAAGYILAAYIAK